MFLEYYWFLFFSFFCLLISSILFFSSYFFTFFKNDFDKSSSYECGFNPFGDMRTRFEIRFFLIAILFIIFDLEISFFFLWSLSFNFLLLNSILVMSLFVFLLFIGFGFEWITGSLNWDH